MLSVEIDMCMNMSCRGDRCCCYHEVEGENEDGDDEECAADALARQLVSLEERLRRSVY